MAVTLVISESKMGEGQVSKKVKHHTLSFALFADGNDTRCFRRVSTDAGVANRKERYVA